MTTSPDNRSRAVDASLSALLAAFLSASTLGAILLGILSRPPQGNEAVWAANSFYAAIATLLLVLMVVYPMIRLTNRRQLRYPTQFVILVALGAALGIPFAIIGVAVANTPSWWMIGTFAGLWTALLGGALYPLLQRTRAGAISALVLCLTVAAFGGTVILSQ